MAGAAGARPESVGEGTKPAGPADLSREGLRTMAPSSGTRHRTDPRRAPGGPGGGPAKSPCVDHGGAASCAAVWRPVRRRLSRRLVARRLLGPAATSRGQHGEHVGTPGAVGRTGGVVRERAHRSMAPHDLPRRGRTHARGRQRLRRARCRVRSETRGHSFALHLCRHHPGLADALSTGAEVGVRYRGPVSKTLVSELYAASDALLLVLGTGRYVTSGKVFEYLATGLPIISVHDPGNAASEVLKGYPLWFPASDLSPDGVAAALRAGAHAAASHEPAAQAAGRAFAERYSRERQLRPRITALRAAVGATSVE